MMDIDDMDLKKGFTKMKVKQILRLHHGIERMCTVYFRSLNFPTRISVPFDFSSVTATLQSFTWKRVLKLEMPFSQLLSTNGTVMRVGVVKSYVKISPTYFSRAYS